jgi:hypothetical protein
METNPVEQNPNPERTVVIEGKSFVVAYTTNAAQLLDVHLRTSGLGALSDFVRRLVSPTAGITETHLLFWACLEGARKRGARGKLRPWTLDEAGELLDKAPSLKPIYSALLESIQVAAAKRKADEEESDEGKNETAAATEKPTE